MAASVETHSRCKVDVSILRTIQPLFYVREGIPQCLWRDLVVRLERGGWLAQLKSSATHSLDADAPGQLILAHVKHEWFCGLLFVVKLSSSG
jgi:hypothetical protein